MTTPTVQVAAGVTPAATFLADPDVTDDVARMYVDDLHDQGYVGNLTRLWAHSPTALTTLAEVLGMSVHEAGLTFRQRALLVSACASTMSDSYCSLAWGAKLSAAAGEETAMQVLAGDDSSLAPDERVLAAWARRMVREPNATTESHVAELREAGFDERQIFALTFFVALRLAFSTVNDTLGATPDVELADRVPPGVRAVVTFGRTPSPR
jgi:alkylhydroperoxidase family enzyme